MPVNKETNEKRHMRRSRQRKNKPKIIPMEKQLDCICQDFTVELDRSLYMIEKPYNGQFEVTGICTCPMHGLKKFVAFYVKNTRDVDLEGYMEEDLTTGVRKMICCTMH